MLEYEKYNKIEMVKNNIRIDSDKMILIDQLRKTLDISKEKLFDNMIQVYAYHRICVVSIRCKVSKKVYVELFGIDKVLNKNFGIKVFNNCESFIRNDLVQYGVGEFEIEVHAIFRSNVEALNYRDFLINRYLDLGYGYYGFDLANGIIPRFLTIRLDLVVIDKLFKFCRDRKISVNKLITKLISKVV